MDSLPKSIWVGADDLRVVTDYRHWMDLQRVLSAPSLTEWERLNAALFNTYGHIPADIEAAADGMMWFYQCGEEPRGSPAPERLLDWDRDFPAIWGDFRLYYRLDLRRISYLHWWEFMPLFRSLPKDAEIKRRMSIRQIDLSKVKDPQTREEYRKMKEIVALDPPDEGMDDFYSRLL